ncbi:MAG: hypothetical protein M0R40_08945 [Firmicutes bacterium]|nr:hypothetical protein [Bacillota bacterium]
MIKPPTLSTNFSESGKRAKKRFDNILNVRGKKAGLLSFALIICVILVAGFIVSSAGSKQVIKTKYFSVSLPKEYEITEFSPENGTFKILLNGSYAGYADIRNAAYYEGLKNATTPSFDNHSRTLSKEELLGFPALVYRLLIEHTRPAAEMDDTITTLEHYLLFNDADGFMVNLALNIEMFTEQQRMDITKSVSVAIGVEESTEIYNLADIWAKAWMTRDGKARYDIMSAEMKAKFEAEQERVNGDDGDPWVIRWSSPWVTSYTILVEGDTATITYQYTDSTAAVYEGYEQIIIERENDMAVVVSQNVDYEKTILK